MSLSLNDGVADSIMRFKSSDGNERNERNERSRRREWEKRLRWHVLGSQLLQGKLGAWSPRSLALMQADGFCRLDAFLSHFKYNFN